MNSIREKVTPPDKAGLLRRVLELEGKNGYSDQAVIGGLDSFLILWARPIRDAIRDPRVLRRFDQLGLTASNYSAFSKEQRRDWAKKVCSCLDEVAKGGPVQSKTLPVPPKKPAVTKIVPPSRAQNLDLPITSIKGINTGFAGKFGRLGVKTVRDMLYFFPRRHLDYSQRTTIAQLVPDKEQTVIANIWEARVVQLGRRRATEATIGDETGNMRAVWFNQPYLAARMQVNSSIVLSGKVSIYRGQKVFESPAWEPADESEFIHTGRLVPLYASTQGLWPRQVRRLMKEVVDQWGGQVTDFLPADIKIRCALLDLPKAISQAHFPDNQDWKDRARQRLAFDELFLLQLGVMMKKRHWQADRGLAFKVESPLLSSFISSLPFKLTLAQQRVMREITADLAKPVPMSRLLQGEVGSGKTVVAAAAVLLAVANGCQGAMMAPTEILAEQHFATIGWLLSRVAKTVEEGPFLKSFEGLSSESLTVALLTGSMTDGEKKKVQSLILEGKVHILLGTHALIQKGVQFKKLGLVVVDEQHRFGVEQRSALRQKGFNPHMIVMTATPIPRTLALTLYGDLDLSVIDELPPGRQVVKTRWLGPDEREKAYDFIRRQVSEGRQAFIICPLIEESESVEAKAAVAEYQRLSQEVFPSLKLGLLHGRMTADEKDKVMRGFREGEYHILVSTPVVEVGIDIPNATVMLVETAARFGMSQLHQFRGRVGRGEHPSYCILLAEEPSPEGRERLQAIERIHNGFLLAEEDLKMRGPGEFFGTRQSGLPDLRMARLSDVGLLEMARTEALSFFSQKQGFDAKAYPLLAGELARVWGDKTGEWS